MITELHKTEIKAHIFNALDFYGSTVDAVKDYCADEGVDYHAHRIELEAFRFDCLVEYSELNQTRDR